MRDNMDLTGRPDGLQPRGKHAIWEERNEGKWEYRDEAETDGRM